MKLLLIALAALLGLIYSWAAADDVAKLAATERELCRRVDRLEVWRDAVT